MAPQTQDTARELESADTAEMGEVSLGTGSDIREVGRVVEELSQQVDLSDGRQITLILGESDGDLVTNLDAVKEELSERGYQVTGSVTEDGNTMLRVESASVQEIVAASREADISKFKDDLEKVVCESEVVFEVIDIEERTRRED